MTFAAHRLSPAAFDALAAGAGDAAGELRSGQLSKRLLQIVALLREISARCPDTFAAGGFQESYASLAAVRRRCPAAVDAVLLYPQVGAWVAYALRRLVGATASDLPVDDDLGHFGAVATAAALAAGEGVDLTVRVRIDGTLMLPTFGIARLGVGPAWCRVRARPGAPNLDVDLGGTIVAVPVLSEVGNPRWRPLRRLRSTADACSIDVVLDDVDPYRDCYHVGATGRLPAAEIAGWQAKLDQAWALLVRRHRHRALSLSTGLAALIPLRSGERAPGSSASASDACGAIALTRPADGRALAVALVHEFQHSKLSALLDLVPLHDASVDAVFYAPWRSDPRPLGGLLQGAYAYLGLVDFWQVRRLAEAGAECRVAQFEFVRWHRAVRRVLQTIAASGRLTDAGRRFLAGMRRRLVELRAALIPPEPGLLARDALLDHWISWRLRNLRPAPDRVDAWAGAWLSGTPCPPTGPPPVVIVSGGRWTGAGAGAGGGGGARLDLAYLRLRDPSRFRAGCSDPSRLAGDVPGAVPADGRYAHGDYQAAARLYRDEVAGSPDRVDLWAGLVLAHRRLRTPAARFLVAYPESVRVLHQRIRALSGRPPDAEALADWLGHAHRGMRRARAELAPYGSPAATG